MQRFACAPYVAPNEADRAMCSDTISDDDLVELDAAVGFGHVDAQQAQLAASAQQRPGEVPVLLLEPLDGRHHLARGELLGRLRDEPVLVGHPLRGEGSAGPVGSISQAPPRVAVAVVMGHSGNS